MKKVESLLEALTIRPAATLSRDMRAWRTARDRALNPQRSERRYLIELVQDLMFDPYLSAKVDLRLSVVMGKPFTVFDHGGEKNDALTELLSNSPAFNKLLKVIVETPMYGHSLVELLPSNGDLFTCSLLPRTHLLPPQGVLLPDVSMQDGIHYRDLPGYGKNIFEFGEPSDTGVLFSCGPATLYRRYALASWSEFSEIYGIPPRILKMDTQDREALERAKSMMQQMGSASWAIVDTNEEMSFAQGLSDNGTVFEALIRAASQEISLKVLGAVMGEDTENGNYSKEESAIKLLGLKTAEDVKRTEAAINRTVLPGLAAIGLLPDGLSLYYNAEKDAKELWNRVVQLLPYAPVEAQFIREEFGIPIAQGVEHVGGAHADAVNDTVNDTVNAQNLSALLGKSVITIKRDLYVLRDLNLIQFVGSDKTGHWEVK